MSEMTLVIRRGSESDINALAELFDIANHGDIAAILGKRAGRGETWKDVCARQMLDPNSEIHPDKALVAEVDGAVAGALFFFPQMRWPNADLSALQDHELPFAILRCQAPDCVFLRDLAVFEQYRGHRIASTLLDTGIGVGFHAGLKHAVVIVHETNTLQLAHYAKRGFAEIASHEVVAHNSFSPESRWLLLQLDAPQNHEAGHPAPPSPSH
jgi:ribosomal protein S18 acetylase RimI-like enzyme